MVNSRGIGRERIERDRIGRERISNFYSREFELGANTPVSNKGQIHIQTLTGFATYIGVYVSTH